MKCVTNAYFKKGPVFKAFTRLVLGLGLIVFASSCNRNEAAYSGPLPIDPSVTPETRNLLASIHRIGWSDQIVLGQEMPLSLNRAQNFNTDLDQSDCKDVTGDHPGLHGGDFHYIIYKPEERAGHLAAARRACESGAIVVFNFHWYGKYSGTFRPDEADDQILANFVNGDDTNGDVTWVYKELDTVLDIINDDLGFPIVFRPLHEMNGSWFWWGRQMKGGAETYRSAYRMIVEYMAERTDKVLYCWSPDKAFPEEFYPGDDYVDIVGIDAYNVGMPEKTSIEKMAGLLDEMIDFAEAHGKVAAFTETGATVDPNFDYTVEAPRWWTENLMASINASRRGHQLAWVQTWINARWSGPYLPHAGASQASKDDFKAFCADPNILLQNEVAALKIYEAPTP